MPVQTIWNHRDALTLSRGQLEKGQLTVGFIGGSITQGSPGHNWPEAVMNWLIETFPACRFTVENAGIGATGSALAVFRAERDIVQRDCDLVFVEYAVNDLNAEPEQRARTREGLVRKLLQGGARDVVFVYTYGQRMYEDMLKGGVPDSISEFEQIAEHYRCGSIWMGLYSLEEVKKGRMRWEEWLPDGLHPTARGSLSYAQSVIAFLEKEWLDPPRSVGRSIGNRMPQPLNENHWGQATLLPFSEVKLEGPWMCRRSTNMVWTDLLLTTAAPGARLHFAFEGRGIALGMEFGKKSADFMYALDNGGWEVRNIDRPGWISDESGMYKLELITDDLPPGQHTISIEIIHGNKAFCNGTNFRLAFIGIIR